MRALLVVLAGVALLVGVATQPASAGKGTDFDRFIKQIGKFAVDSSGSPKPKGLCVCQDGGPNHSQVGALVYAGLPGAAQVSVKCWVRVFLPDGTFSGASACETFEVLSK